MRGTDWPMPTPKRTANRHCVFGTEPKYAAGLRVSIASPLMQPSPNGRRVGIRLSLSRPAQALRVLQPIASLNRLRRPLSRGSSPSGHPTEPLVSYQINRQLSWVDSSSTGNSRLRGALPNSDIRVYVAKV
jgi:hypothetical protein